MVHMCCSLKTVLVMSSRVTGELDYNTFLFKRSSRLPIWNLQKKTQ